MSETDVSFVPMEAVGEYGGLDLSTTKQLGDVGNGYTYFRNGDVVVAKITPCFENGKGASSASDAGDTSVTAGAALQLSCYLGTAAAFWIGLQAQYDLEIDDLEIASDRIDKQRKRIEPRRPA